MPEKVCPCGVIFRGRRRSKFCSRACSNLYQGCMARSAEFVNRVGYLTSEGKSRSQVGKILGVTKGVISGVAFRRGIKPPSHV